MAVAFNLLTQKLFRMTGTLIETGVGPTAFVTTATTVKVPTHLTHIIFGLAVCVTGGQLAAVTTGAVSGEVTFTRPANGTSADTIQYILVGW